MDPATTLFTFMLQTNPSVRTVHLVGSWDNFSTYRMMERDTRRGQGQWRGCYSFRDTICGGDNGRGMSRKNGGLRMGSTYFYYYELDGSKEVHDPSMPSTTACPSLPGQKVNTLSIPVEHSLRQRSASLSSIRPADFKTMNPKDKFVCPRPAPPIPESRPASRLGSSPTPFSVRPSPQRPVSPAPSWKRFLGFKIGGGRDVERGRPATDRPATPASSVAGDDCQSVTSEGSRTRDISPESLRRFLSDEPPRQQQRPAAAAPSSAPTPTLLIPEDILEEHEDDDNFATSALSDCNFFGTSLSPPPSKPLLSRPVCPSPVPLSDSRAALAIALPDPGPEPLDYEKTRALFGLPSIHTSGPRSHFSLSTVSSAASPVSPCFPHAGADAGEDDPSFCEAADQSEGDLESPAEGEEEDEEEEEDFAFRNSATGMPVAVSPRVSSERTSAHFTGYWLPDDDGEKPNRDADVSFASGAELRVTVDGPAMLDIQIGGQSDFADELGWMVDVIQHKNS